MPKNYRILFFGLFLAFFPLICFGIIGLLYTSQFKYYLKEIVEFGLSTFILYALGILIFKGIGRLYWFFICTTLLYIIGILKTGFYYLFQSKINISAFYIIFETTGNESAGFLETQFETGLILLLAVFILFLFLHYKVLIRLYKIEQWIFNAPTFQQKNIPIFLILIGGVLGSFYLIHLKLRGNNIIYLVKDSYISYTEAQDLFQTNLVKPTSDYFTNVKASDSSQTYVVIIGESTSSRNMSLYGYYRNTTPLLSSLDSNETIVFKDVISPHTHTIPSLNKALSLANYENPDEIYKGSIVQLANAAGFATYWISNQQPIGIHETLLTAMSKATKEQVFTNALTNKQLEYDEALFPHIRKVLEKQEPKKVIFIHLTGTHISYKFTYPEAFQHFTDTPKTKFPSERSTEQINHYDNSILYNDFVVNTIIEEVKKTNSNSYVLYFSDHGDEVFQDLDFVGHSEYHASKPMHEIPFVLWASEKYQKFNPSYDSLKNYTFRKYMLDDFIHSFSDLSQIKFDQWQPERSIFYPDFKDRTRIIRNGIDYDNR